MKDVKEFSLANNKLNDLNNYIEELIQQSNNLKNAKQEKIFNPLLKILKLTIFMTLSRNRLNKISENMTKSKFELNQLNTKIDEVKNSIKVRIKYFRNTSTILKTEKIIQN